MTVKLVALWSPPEDAEGFAKDYEATHIDLVAKLPGIKSFIASTAVDANGPYCRMAELIFDDAATLGSALGSPEGAALLADAGRLQETFGNKVDVITVEEQTRV